MSKTNEIIITIKKELRKFCSNKRLLFSTVVLPGLLIAILYNVMGNIVKRQENASQTFDSSICVINLPSDIEKIFEGSGIKYKIVDSSKSEDIKAKIANENEYLLVLFPEEFDIAKMAISYQCPNIEIYYNASSTESMNAYLFVTELLAAYEEQIANAFDINRDDKVYNVATEEESMAKNMAMILPMLLMGLIFSACMPIAAESIAGEKEHGTIAALLVTPIKRYNLAAGKIISSSIMAMGGAISSFIGIIYSLPQILDASGEELLRVYGLRDYLFLFLTLLSIVGLMITLMSIVSASSKSIKEASTILSPFAAVVMILGMTCMIQNGVMDQKWVYLIPLYNNIQQLYNILNFKIDYMSFAIMFGSNLAYAGIFVVILSKMFKSEKFMFG